MPYSYSVSHVAGGQAQAAASNVHGVNKDDQLFHFASHGNTCNLEGKDLKVGKSILKGRCSVNVFVFVIV